MFSAASQIAEAELFLGALYQIFNIRWLNICKMENTSKNFYNHKSQCYIKNKTKVKCK